MIYDDLAPERATDYLSSISGELSVEDPDATPPVMVAIFVVIVGRRIEIKCLVSVPICTEVQDLYIRRETTIDHELLVTIDVNIGDSPVDAVAHHLLDLLWVFGVLAVIYRDIFLKF